MPDEHVQQITLSGTPRIRGILTEVPKLSGTLSNRQMTLFGTLTRSASVDYYTGEYVVRPSTDEQVLQTSNKLMSRDVLVEEIPYFETSNPSGGYTVIIG